MSNGNEPTTSPPQHKEVCSIRVIFPITSDEQAIAYKKQISDILCDIPEAHIEFSIRPLPTAPPMGVPSLRQ